MKTITVRKAGSVRLTSAAPLSVQPCLRGRPAVAEVEREAGTAGTAGTAWDRRSGP